MNMTSDSSFYQQIGIIKQLELSGLVIAVWKIIVIDLVESVIDLIRLFVW